MAMMKTLTQQEAESLPDNSRVRITWSGGNGPHWYILRTNKWGYKDVMYQSWDKQEYLVDTLGAMHLGPAQPSDVMEVED